MTPDYRALCAELNHWVVELAASHPNLSDSAITWINEVVDRAASALAQPEPVAPTDEDLEDLAEVMNVSGNPVPAMRRALELWGRPANQPVPVTDKELGRRFRAWWHDEGSGLPPLPGMDHKEHVRRISEIAWANGAYVARYGTPAIEPVPVSERLPGADDCDAEGRCWIFMPDIGTDPSWRLTDPRDIGPYHTHWLPANALPTREATND
jgi:hypothetical protein